MLRLPGYLFLQVKDGGEFHQNKSLTNITEFTVIAGVSIYIVYHRISDYVYTKFSKDKNHTVTISTCIARI